MPAFPPLHVVQHEGNLIAICGNCQLYLHRVLVNLRVVVWPLGPAGPPGPVRRFVNSSKKCPSGARSIVKSACAEARAGNITALRTFLAESPTQVDIATRVPHVAGFGHDEYIKLLLEHGASAIAPQARSDEECDIPVLPGALTTSYPQEGFIIVCWAATPTRCSRSSCWSFRAILARHADQRTLHV